MKLKTPTILLVGVAAILGLVAIAELQEGDRSSGGGAEPLFSFAEDDINALEIETSTTTLDLERDDSGTWQLQQPQQAPVNEATVTFLLNLLATEESDRTFSVAAQELDSYALDTPQATVEIGLEDGSRHKLLLGDYDFSNEYLYAQVDPEEPPETPSEDEPEVEVQLVPASFDSAINRPLQDWIQLETEAETGTAEENDQSPSNPDAILPEESAPNQPAPNEAAPDESEN